MESHFLKKNSRKRLLLGITVIPVTIRTANGYVGVEVKPREEMSVLGDLMRSEESASSFFKMVDRDGDGTLRAPEVAKFLKESIGGTSFDEDKEVDNEVLNVMKRLDRNHDNGLDKSDMFAYWKQLESLLTAEEVAEWVVYAVQLPNYVGSIFRDNVVTGYDFPELVENDGEALEKELGISKPSFRRKIVRLAQARMLGIGSLPTNPPNASFVVENCSAIHLSWGKSTSIGFPVHSYRLQRRLVGDNSFVSENFVKNRDICEKLRMEGQLYDASQDAFNLCSLESVFDSGQDTNDKLDGYNISIKPSPRWQTIYVGSETEFVDSKIFEINGKYNYRVQAWNSAGRSAWVKFDAEDPSYQTCFENNKSSLKLYQQNRALPHSETPNRDNYTSATLSAFDRTWLVANILANISRFIMTILALGAAFLKYRRATAKSTYLSMDPIFPSFFIGIDNFTKKFFGIEIIPKSLLGEEEDSSSCFNDVHDETVKAVGLNGYQNIVQSKRKMRKMTSSTSLETEKPSSSQEQLSTRPKLFKLKSAGTLLSNKSDHSSNVSDRSVIDDNDDMKFCTVCKKRYKFPRRFRHHCSRCTATFCHKHGKTTHSNLVACGVPGSCLCQNCVSHLQRNASL